MKAVRRAIARKLSGRPLTFIIHGILRLLHASMRITLEGKEHLEALAADREGYIAIFWHARMLMVPFIYPGKRIYVLISIHRDGEIIANVMTRFGFRLVRGSSSRGGKEAFHEMVRLLVAGNDVAITPDGPRGPAEVLKPGTARLARVTGKAVVPVAFASSRGKRLASWDRLLIPYPFSRGVFVLGEPLRAREGEDDEALRRRIEEALAESTRRADELAAGRPSPLTPDPARP